MTHHPFTLLLCTLTLLATSAVAPSQAADFRETTWGMSVQEVQSAERESGAPLAPSLPISPIIAFDRTVAEFPVRAVYYFLDQQLVNAGYIFSRKHSEHALYLEDFSAIHTILTKKYGTPTTEKEEWKNPLLQSDKTRRGMAVAMGHLTMTTIWETERTRITHSLRGDNFTVSHIIRYQSLAHANLVQKATDDIHANEF